MGSGCRPQIVEQFQNNVPKYIPSAAVHNIIRFKDFGDISVHKRRGRKSILDVLDLRAALLQKLA